MGVLRAAVALIVRSMVVSAQAAGQQRSALLQRAIVSGDAAGEVARLRDENRRLRSENRMLKARFGDAPSRAVMDKFPVLQGKETVVRIDIDGQQVIIGCDGQESWSGTIESPPKALCVGAFRWPWRNHQTGPAGQTAEYLVRDVSIS